MGPGEGPGLNLKLKTSLQSHRFWINFEETTLRDETWQHYTKIKTQHVKNIEIYRNDVGVTNLPCNI